jgi:hypothetical protein
MWKSTVITWQLLKCICGSWCGRRDLNPGSQAWKACVLNQLDDDRHSDTVVLETKKAIDSKLTITDTQEGTRISPNKEKVVCFFQL